MAKVMGPFHSVEASGVVGALVGVRGRHGGGVRGWADRCDQRTMLQTWDRRAVFAYCSRVWRELGDGERMRWGEYDEGVVGGRQCFLAFNLRRRRYGLGLMEEAPLVGSGRYFPAVSMEWTDDGGVLSFAPEIPAGAVLVVRQARNESVCRMRPVRGRVSHVLGPGDVSPVNVTGPVGGPAEPEGWPAVEGVRSQHVYVWAVGNPGGATVAEFRRMVSPEYVEVAVNVELDTMPWELYPDAAWWDRTYWSLQGALGFRTRVLMWADLGGLEGRRVKGAWLWCRGMDDAVGREVACHEVLVEWSEHFATWNERMAGVAWGVPGMEAGVDYDAVASDVQWCEPGEWWRFDVRGMVGAWLAGARENRGLVLMRTGADFWYLNMWSSKCGEPSWRPYLLVRLG